VEKLSYGSRGAAVELAQAALNFQLSGIHPKLEVDGQFGDATKAATIALQRSAGLRDKDGIIGQDTYAVLYAFYTLDMPMIWTRKPKPGGIRGVGSAPKLTLQPPNLNIPHFKLPPLLPPLVLPPIGPVAPPPLFPGLLLTLPVAQGSTANFPVSPSEVEVFALKGMIFKPHLLTLKGSVESVTELTGENRVDATVKLEHQIFSVGGVDVGAYVKATAEVDPNKPGDSAVKLNTGLTFKLNAGRLTIEVSPTMELLKVKPGSGEVKGGANFIGGMLTIGAF
jgi:hypothetical protein